MQKEDYIGYIAHFVANVDQNTPIDEYRKFFVKTLGTANVVSAPEAKVKDLSRNFYKAYVAHTLVRYSPFYLVYNLSGKQLSDLVNEQVKLVEKYGLYTAVSVDISPSGMDKHIKKDSATSYKSILAKYLPKAEVAKKTTTRKAAPKKVSAQKKKVPAPREETKKKAPAKKKSIKSFVSRAAVCKDYTMPELKEMAKGKIKGFSKLKKTELCEALKIKE